MKQKKEQGMKQTFAGIGALDPPAVARDPCPNEPMTLVLPAGLELRIVTGGCGTKKENGNDKCGGKPTTLGDPTSPSPRRDGGEGSAGSPCCAVGSGEVLTIALPPGQEVRLIVAPMEHPKMCDVAMALDDPTSPSPSRDGGRATARIEPARGVLARKPSPRG
jgi:hypothetical protein